MPSTTKNEGTYRKADKDRKKYVFFKLKWNILTNMIIKKKKKEKEE